MLFNVAGLTVDMLLVNKVCMWATVVHTCIYSTQILKGGGETAVEQGKNPPSPPQPHVEKKLYMQQG